jgi:glucose/arabinose dehydrogenase
VLAIIASGNLAGLSPVVAQYAAQVAANLPEPNPASFAIKFPKIIAWPEGKTPQAPEGLKVTAFVRDLESPRWIYVLPNGDVLVAQSRTLPKLPKPEEEQAKPPEKKEDDKKKEEGMKESKTVTGDSPNKITLLRDADGNGEAEINEAFLEGLNQPFGMALIDDRLFVANTDAVMSYPYEEGDTTIADKGMKILDLPAGGYNNHWTRNLLASRDGTKLYISIGSASNNAEHGTAEEVLRANILECNLDGTALRVFASGLRNPVGMDWNPANGELWTAVNERDELGDELVPDYITSVEDGGFYGWPYAYFGQHEDPRMKGQRPDLVKKTLIPDVATGAHTASLGLAFYDLLAPSRCRKNTAAAPSSGSAARGIARSSPDTAWHSFRSRMATRRAGRRTFSRTLSPTRMKCTAGRWAWPLRPTAPCWWPTSRRILCGG